MAVDLMEVLPSYFRPILEFQEIMKTEGEAAEEVERTADRLSDNCFIQTCDEATLAYYERLLQISNIGATLEERRRILLLQWNMESLYTLPKLKEFLASAVGEDNYEIKCFYNEYLVKIWISSQTAVMLRNLYNSIFRMTPAHIILEVYGRYLGNYEVPIEYENKIRFFSEFYPRFNLAVLKLDGTWKLDGSRKLNGYDSNETLDFYPVAMSVIVPVTVPVQTELSCRYQMTAMENVKAEAAPNICTEAAENVRMEQRLTCQSEAEISVLQTEAFMYKKNLLDGSWKLSGSRKLDGGRYDL
ncbi:MAG: DUF2313 domain-containing protein [Clostridium sp.]|nr:DUF2313 domain-containing protein [Clostridium sp.]